MDQKNAPKCSHGAAAATGRIAREGITRTPAVALPRAGAGVSLLACVCVCVRVLGQPST
jgi:hypothetical protein